jgi:hypothetical protein
MRTAVTLAIVCSICAMPTVALASTFYVDGASGSDTNAGTSATTAWRTWARMLAGIQDGTVAHDDTVLIRPGRYYASDGGGSDTNWRIPGPAGGTAGHPITISVDTSVPGDVEIAGAVPGSFNPAHGRASNRSSNWTATTDASGHAVYYTVSHDDYQSASVVPGVAFQPGATCSGGTNVGRACAASTDCRSPGSAPRWPASPFQGAARRHSSPHGSSEEA